MAVDPPSVVAVFDFDHTFIDRDSLVPFLIHLVGPLKTYAKLTLLTPYFIAFLLHLISRQTIKEMILSSFLEGFSFHHLQEKGKEYADTTLDQFIRPQAMERLRWHQEQGHCCILVSASLDLYLKPWAIRHEFQHVISSQLAVTKEATVTGHLVGLNCWGPEKRRRLLELLGPDFAYELYAYGDSRGDRELLEIADHPFYRTFV